MTRIDINSPKILIELAELRPGAQDSLRVLGSSDRLLRRASNNAAASCAMRRNALHLAQSVAETIEADGRLDQAVVVMANASLVAARLAVLRKVIAELLVHAFSEPGRRASYMRQVAALARDCSRAQDLYTQAGQERKTAAQQRLLRQALDASLEPMQQAIAWRLIR